ncbi:ROK family transcriptional regulator [Plantibacter sp. YIM 135249]|uniref:ROK family transcriptional regulator n=1 Tax=Plantibacter sp. YIM 135249 TaxID=3423918 RepID=UPI003D33C152
MSKPIQRPHRHRNPGSQSALRQSNQQRILQALLVRGPLTQAELSRHTGLSTATVSNIVKALVSRGLLQTEPTTSSGRRALEVSLSADGAVSVGIDFGRSHLRIVITSLDYRVIAEEMVRLPIGHQAHDALQTAAELLARLLVSAHVPRSAVLGVGVGIPGPIDGRTGTVIDGTILPEWVGITVDYIQEHLQFPVHIENDANLGALAEITWGPHGGVSNLVFVKIGTGIGCGLILNGTLFKGSLGVSGEIGHIPVHDHGLVCRCGNRGCLETVASTAIMIELLSRSPQHITTAGELVEAALSGDTATLRVVHDAGLAVGRSLATIANFVNPEVIVVGGPLAGLGDLLLGPIRDGLLRYAAPIVGANTELRMSAFTDRAEALGAAALGLQELDVDDFVTIS